MYKDLKKRVLSFILAIGLCISLISGCVVKEPNAKEIVKHFFESNVKPLDVNNPDFFGHLINELKSSEKRRNKANIDFEIPFSFVATSSEASMGSGLMYGQINDDMSLNGIVKVNADIEFTNMGYIENFKTFKPHYLFKIICGYKLNIGGSFAPMGFGFDGRFQCYLKLDEDLNLLEVYYKLNDYDKNWYEYIIANVKDAMIAIPDLIESNNQILKDNIDNDANDKYSELENHIKDKISQYMTHIIDKAADSAVLSNKNVTINEANISDAYEIKFKLNYFDEDTKELFISSIKEVESADNNAIDEDIKTVETILDQFVDNIIINNTMYVVDGENSSVNNSEYSVVKATADLTDINIDYSFDNIRFTASFDKGKIEEYVYTDFEIEYIPDNVLQESLVVDQIDLNELLSHYGNKT